MAMPLPHDFIPLDILVSYAFLTMPNFQGCTKCKCISFTITKGEQSADSLGLL